MKQRGIYFVVGIYFILFFMSPIQAATTTQIYAGNQLRTLGILKGYDDGSLKLDNNITRAEVATIMTRILSEANPVRLDKKEFKDVANSHWAYKFIQNSYQIGLIQGYPDDTFLPENKITYGEVITMMVNALGEKDKVNPELNWPDNMIEKAKELKVIPKNSTVSPTKQITRGEMALIVWDTILVKK